VTYRIKCGENDNFCVASIFFLFSNLVQGILIRFENDVASLA